MADLNIIPEEIKIFVNPDPVKWIYTGGTLTNAIGSGSTTVTTSGDTMIVYTAPGATSWGNINGTLSDQTDLQNALDGKLNEETFNTYTGTTGNYITLSAFDTYTGDTETELIALQGDIDTVSGDTEQNTTDIIALESDIDTISGNTEQNTTDIIALESDLNTISGQTDTNTSDISSLQTSKLNTTLFETYTGNTQTTLTNLENDKLEITTFNTYTGDTETELNALESEFDNYVPASGGTFTGDLQGTSLQLSGDLTVNGTMNTVHAQEVWTENDFIYMRSGATTGLGVGEVSGIAALNVDGSTTAVMGVTNDGLIRVGWSGDTLQAVATREDAPTDEGFAQWDTTTEKFVTTGLTLSQYKSFTASTLTNLVISSPTQNEVLAYNGTNWVNKLSSDYKEVYNNGASTIPAGTLITITDSASVVIVSVADKDTNDVVSGIAVEDIDPATTGIMQINGSIQKSFINTFGMSGGDKLYLSDDGGYTNIKPTSGYIIQIGIVGLVASSSGSIVLNLPATEVLEVSDFETYTGNTETELIALQDDIDTISGDTEQNTTDITSLENNKADKTATINSISTSQSVQSGWSNEIIEAIGTITITLPTGLNDGFQFTVVNVGTGTISFSAGTGATLNSKDNNTSLASQYGAVTGYYKSSSDTWVIIGDLS